MIDHKPIRDRRLPLCMECSHLQDCESASGMTWPTEDCPRRRLSRVSPTSGRLREEGLCATCQKRHQCDKRKVEGGIWRCSDYV